MSLRRRRAKRLRELQERIKKLEQWHRIFDEYSAEGDYERALEMAKQGVTYVSHALKEHYLPTIRTMLNEPGVVFEYHASQLQQMQLQANSYQQQLLMWLGHH